MLCSSYNHSLLCIWLQPASVDGEGGVDVVLLGVRRFVLLHHAVRPQAQLPEERPVADLLLHVLPDQRCPHPTNQSALYHRTPRSDRQETRPPR